MWTTKIGQQAEKRVGNFLKNNDYQLLARNWRTTVCEIDLVAKKLDVIYFVEVKYRHRQTQGEGFDCITPKKLKQMKFAAQIWNQHNNWDGDWRLVVASVTDYKIEIVEVD